MLLQNLSPGVPTGGGWISRLPKELAHKRRFVANNDGCDCLYYPKDQVVSKKLFLQARTTALGQSQVTTISYCTVSSGFGYFTHNTKAGEVLRVSASESGAEFDSSVVILFVLVLVLDWNHCMQQKQEAMDIDDDRPCFPVEFEYEYRFAEYEYDILFLAPLRSLPQASRYAGGT